MLKMAKVCAASRASMTMLLCLAIFLSILVIVLCTIAISNHNVAIVTHHSGYLDLIFKSQLKVRTLCANSSSKCTTTENHINLTAIYQLVYAEKKNHNGQILDILNGNTHTQIQGSTTASGQLHVHRPTDSSYDDSNRRNDTSILTLRTSALQSTSHTHHVSRQAHAQQDLLRDTTPTRRGGSQGYVLAAQFEEQLCSAFYDLYQLANVVTSWGDMTVVEPHVQGSQFKFQAPPPKTVSQQGLWFRDVFDLNETNLLLQSCLKYNNSVITLFESFAENASKIEHIVVLYFSPYKESLDTCKTVHNSNVLELKRRLNSYVRLVLRNRGNFKLANFTRVPHTIVCSDGWNAVDFRGLLTTNQHIKQVRQSHSNILILIPKWRGIRKVPDKFFYFDPSYKQPRCDNLHSIPQSKRIQSAAEKYKKFLQLEQPYLGVHIRLERVIRANRYQIGYMSRCVSEFFQVLQNVLITHNSNKTLKLVAFNDYSLAGSMTCADIGCKRIADQLKIDKKLTELGVKTNHFSPAMFGEPPVSGYVAMTELELLSRADYLVTLGHGSYNRRLVHRFKANHGGIGKERDGRRREEVGGNGGRLFTVCSQL